MSTEFLSTPSARRATLCGLLCPLSLFISIHALREEGDTRLHRRSCRLSLFLSTPSARRATYLDFRCFCGFSISIHALREEGDYQRTAESAESRNFYPRPPRGGRHYRLVRLAKFDEFLSTPSARRATKTWNVRDQTDTFLSTPSARRATWIVQIVFNFTKFLSTPSARRATAKTETKSLFSNKLYNILHEFRRALIYNGSKSYPNHAK